MKLLNHSQELLVEDIFKKKISAVSAEVVTTIVIRHARPHKQHAVRF